MSFITLSSREVRELLQNAGKIKEDSRCIYCNGTGFENWDGSTGEDIKPGFIDMNLPHNENRLCGECVECKGIGFII